VARARVEMLKNIRCCMKKFHRAGCATDPKLSGTSMH
jgi:hypothetical protein